MTTVPNFLSLQPLLIDRLRSALDAAGHQAIPVLAYPAVTSLEGGLPAPCIFVLYDGYSVAETSTSGKNARIGQQWHAVTCVRHTANLGAALQAIDLAGQLVDLCLTTLMGWQPTGTARPLQLTSAPKASIEDGYHYFATAFDTEIIRKAA